MSPTARTLAEAKRLGFTAGVVEKWIPQMRRRVDFIGCIDLILFREGVGTIGVQATSGANHASRRTKSLAEPRLREWLRAGNRFEVWSWAKQGAQGKRKTWTLRREEVFEKDLNGVNQC